jgi:diguanylate cyclase (GGDEF)-like protein
MVLAHQPTSERIGDAGESLVDGPSADDAIAAVHELGLSDILVFELSGERFRLVGGVGRGPGWAGIVELEPANEPYLDRAWRTGVPIRLDGAPIAHVAGPYWAAHAVVVPIGNDHLVVLGGPRPIAASDATLVRTAARAASDIRGVPAEKRLADELELVHALRALMAYRPETVRDTVRHVARVAARALACEYVAVHVEHDERIALEVLHRDRDDVTLEGPDAAHFLARAAASARPILEQGAGARPRVFTSPVVSRLTIPVGRDQRLGALSLGHAADAPRGFTMLCQRIGLALAEAAELLITQAFAREQLAEDRDRLHRLSRTDALTDLGNRVAWEEAADACGRVDTGASAMVISADLDGLKAINDRYGHPVGDIVIRAAGGILRSTLRETDLIARTGGDEFLALCCDVDARSAGAIVRRLGRTRLLTRVTEHELTPELSFGWAMVEDGDVAAAVRLADARMYASKRRRKGRARKRPDRRVRATRA